jgi:predicted RNase H-like HicB family nuclease
MVANLFRTLGKLLGLFSGRSCQLRDRVYAYPMKVTAVVHKADEGGFWAEVPSLPGCRTQGDTMDELKANLREAVELYLETDPSGLTADKNSQLLELAV